MTQVSIVFACPFTIIVLILRRIRNNHMSQDQLSNSILQTAKDSLGHLQENLPEIIEIYKPPSMEFAVAMTKIVSKLSPLVGNMIEYATIFALNKDGRFKDKGKWIRQDPGFPDAFFEPFASDGMVKTGIEIKAWLPLATEITARLKDSQNIFLQNNYDVALIAWIPEFIFWGKPQILDVLVVSGLSVAQARDNHYHNPPDYIVCEPEDTSSRTRNLQQTNTTGHKLQPEGDRQMLFQRFQEWGVDYSLDPDYQSHLKSVKRYYREDTNYAKLDRIEHPEIEQFKTRVENMIVCGNSISAWGALLDASPSEIEFAVQKLVKLQQADQKSNLP